MKNIRLIMTGLESHNVDADAYLMNLCFGDWCKQWIEEDKNNIPTNILAHPWVDNKRYEDEY